MSFRSLKKYAIFIGIAATVVGILGQKRLNERASEHELIFGTRESPSFQIKKSNYETCPTFRDLSTQLNERNKEIEKYGAESRTIYEELKNIEKKISDKLTDREKQNILELVKKKRSQANSIYNKVNEKINSMPYSELSQISEELNDKDGLSYDEKLFGSIEKRVNKLFLNMTGKKVPSNINMSLIPSDEDNIAGWHDLTKNSIFIEERAYSSTLNTYIHELGHVVDQHAEEKYFNRAWFIPSAPSFEVRVLEEACAYSFTNASIGFIDDEKLRKQAMRSHVANMVSNILWYKDGEVTAHTKGMALCDAANEYFKNPSDAFNYLSRTSEKDIKNEIWALAEDLKKVNLPEDDSLTAFKPVFLSMKIIKKLEMK